MYADVVMLCVSIIVLCVYILGNGFFSCHISAKWVQDKWFCKQFCCCCCFISIPPYLLRAIKYKEGKGIEFNLI